MASNSEFFNNEAEAVREKAMCADGDSANEPIVPENDYSPVLDILKTLGACAVIMGVGMGVFYIVNKVTKK